MASSGNRQTLGADGTTTFLPFVGLVHLSLTGGFGGGAAKVQWKDPAGNTVDIANGSFTTVTDSVFDFPPGTINELAVNLSGSTTPTLVVIFQEQNPFTTT